MPLLLQQLKKECVIFVVTIIIRRRKRRRTVIFYMKIIFKFHENIIKKRILFFMVTLTIKKCHLVSKLTSIHFQFVLLVYLKQIVIDNNLVICNVLLYIIIDSNSTNVMCFNGITV